MDAIDWFMRMFSIGPSQHINTSALDRSTTYLLYGDQNVKSTHILIIYCLYKGSGRIAPVSSQSYSE